jgi:hypothetical protein
LVCSTHLTGLRHQLPAYELSPRLHRASPSNCNGAHELFFDLFGLESGGLLARPKNAIYSWIERLLNSAALLPGELNSPLSTATV